MRRVAEATRANVVRFGRGGHCDVMATGVECTNGTLSFRIDGAPICVPVWGRHYLDCALAAFAVGRIFEMSAEEIAEALTSFEPPPMRCAVSEIGGVTIIDDTYNASPAAVQAALELLAEFRSRGRHVFVCGDMRELGGDASPLHRRVGDQVVALCGADMLVACGDHAGEMVDAARKAGMPSHCAIACRFPEDAADALAERLEPGDVVLIKGSRALSMERVVERLRNRALRRAA
jgi:UDP-N-acetylmuramoyl-tripeptide--D-alanyl-D-alanine ligase